MSFPRKIVRVGNSEMVALPPAIMQALAWKRGDFVLIYTGPQETVIVSKVQLHQLSDAVISAARDLPQVQYG